MNTTFERPAINIPGQAPAPLGCYSHAVKAGHFLFLSGQGARDATTGSEMGLTLDGDGNVRSYDIAVQTRTCVQNIESVLKAADCTLKDLVDVNIFLADIADFETFNKVYAEYFSFQDPPARTTIEAAKLPGRNYIEIKATAFCSMDYTS